MSGTAPCVLCHADAFESRHALSDRLHHTTQLVFHVVECCGCGLLRLDPQPTPAELPRYYPELYWAQGETRHGAAGAYRRFVLKDHERFILHAAGEHARILDIGCGPGDLLAGLRAHGHRGIGLDVASAALRAASAIGVPAVRADHHGTPFAAGSFDVVMMFHMLEHIADPDAAIAEAWRLLRAGGRLIVQVPNADSWQYALLGRFWSGLDVPRHLLDYRRQDIERFLVRNGFVVRRRKHFSWRDNAPALATSLVPWLEPVARRVRNPRGSVALRLAGDLTYFALMLLCLPFAVLEAAAGHGATVMLDAEKVDMVGKQPC